MTADDDLATADRSQLLARQVAVDSYRPKATMCQKNNLNLHLKRKPVTASARLQRLSLTFYICYSSDSLSFSAKIFLGQCSEMVPAFLMAS